MVGIAKLKWTECTRRDVEAREFVSNYIIEDVNVTAGEGPVTIILGSGLPQLGDYYTNGTEGDTFAACVGYGRIGPVKWDEGARDVWSAQVKYSTDPNKQRRQAENYDNPLNKPPIFSVRGHRRRAAAHSVREDFLGNPVQNSAGGQLRDEDVQVDIHNWTLRITQNQATLDPAQLDHYTNGVNVFQWMGGAAKTWKMEPPEAQLHYWVDTPYWTMTYEFQYNAETWQLKPPDMGTLDANFELHKTFDGVAVMGYSDLDGNGQFRAAGDPRVFFDGVGGNPQPIDWYYSVDFTQLGLPSSLPASS